MVFLLLLIRFEDILIWFALLFPRCMLLGSICMSWNLFIMALLKCCLESSCLEIFIHNICNIIKIVVNNLKYFFVQKLYSLSIIGLYVMEFHKGQTYSQLLPHSFKHILYILIFCLIVREMSSPALYFIELDYHLVTLCSDRRFYNFC